MSLEKQCSCSAWDECDHNWQIRFEIRKRRVRESAGTSSRREAEAFERERWVYFNKTLPTHAPKGTLTISDLAAADFARAEAEGVSEHELKWLVYAWEAIAKYFGGDAPAGVVTYDSTQAYILARLEKVSAQTVRRERGRIAWGAAYAHRKGALPVVPASWPRIRSDDPDAARSGKLHPAPVLRAWFRRLRPDRSAFLAARVFVLTGLRRAELERLSGSWVMRGPDSIDREGRRYPTYMLSVPAWASKTRSAREVGLTREAYAILRHLMKRAPDMQTPLFSTHDYRKAWKRASLSLGYDVTITPRDLRHTWSTLALVATGDAWAVAASQGHADLETTQRYQHSTRERAQRVSEGVASSLAHPPYVARHTELSGRGDWIRTSDPLTPSQLRALIAHVSTCETCRAVITECMADHPIHPISAMNGRHVA